MFLWCHARQINPVKISPERIIWEDKKLVNYLNYDGTDFPVRKILKKRTILALTCFIIKLSWFFQFTFQIKHLKI